MPKTLEIAEYLNTRLNSDAFPSDPSSNGLQVEASENVKTIVFGVDASFALFEEAKKLKADMVVVHHGLFWRGMPYAITGMMAARIGLLFENHISLYASHLPLDAHPTLGHNAVLADYIGVANRKPFFSYAGVPIGVSGECPEALTVEAIANELSAHLQGEEVRVFGDLHQKCKTVGIVSGGGGTGAIEEAAALGLDLLVTGEFMHQSWHTAHELKLPVIALGHYASETVGLLALLDDVKKQFKVKTHFVDIPTQL